MSRWQNTGNPDRILLSENGGLELYNASFSLPVDLVITWVNGSDPSFIEDMERLNISNYLTKTADALCQKVCSLWDSSQSKSAERSMCEHLTFIYEYLIKRQADYIKHHHSFLRYSEATPNRFRDWGSLRFCLRSVEKFANWIRHVYIVTNGQIPVWLNFHNPRVSIVKHLEIFPNKSHLPTFSSAAIECHIHRIPGLSQQFLYMNDDFFFVNNVKPEDFFTKETGFKVRFDPYTKIPECSNTCKLSDLNNGICDKECNTSKCDWDGEDCRIYGTESRPLTWLKRFPGHAGSIVNVVFLYNKEFGYVYRKLPAHVPYIIDKTVIDELQNRFPREWEKTSASKVRDQYNIQYSFAYYHYLLRPQLEERGGKEGSIATTYQNFHDYAYIPIRNPERLEQLLQDLLKDKNKKFVCFNDVVDHKHVTEVEMCQVVTDAFFKQLLPERSSFELEGME